MAVYRLVGDAEFEAQDLADAFTKLVVHFDHLRKGGRSPLFVRGEMQLRRKGNLILPTGIGVKVQRPK